MIQKIDVTWKVLSILNPDLTEKDLETALKSWWCNRRNKKVNGLRLTESGYIAMIEAEIKDHHILFEEPITITNQLTIWLDQYMDCPFFLTNREIVVFGERTAIQLVLFSGNITKFIGILAKRARSA